jgi:hypothetical protein
MRFAVGGCGILGEHKHKGGDGGHSASGVGDRISISLLGTLVTCPAEAPGGKETRTRCSCTPSASQDSMVPGRSQALFYCSPKSRRVDGVGILQDHHSIQAWRTVTKGTEPPHLSLDESGASS